MYTAEYIEKKNTVWPQLCPTQFRNNAYMHSEWGLKRGGLMIGIFSIEQNKVGYKNLCDCKCLAHFWRQICHDGWRIHGLKDDFLLPDDQKIQ